jgi:hypothetical protein
MASSFEKIFAKLDRPPFAHNFVRLVADDELRTAKNIVSLAVSHIPFQYSSAYTVIGDRIQFKIPIDQALKAVNLKGAPVGRPHNASLVKAFYEHDQSREYSAARVIEHERAFFRVSRGILVPVSPLRVIIERGKFVPLFVCGWNYPNLTRLQRRLLATICEDAFLSLTDYADSPAEYLFFPRNRAAEPMNAGPHQIVRTPDIWHRSDYEPLSSAELTEQIEIYLRGRDLAKLMLEEMQQSGRFGDIPSSSSPATDSGQQNLF